MVSLARSLADETSAGSLVNFSGLAANKIRKNRSKPSDKWYLDEVRVVIKGEVHWLWRAVDSHGQVLDILIQKRRNAKAARRLIVKRSSTVLLPRSKEQLLQEAS